ncbi:MAG TPA: TIGR02266 family protein, partial [Polyangia bacterium]|nr:TIGR02266 family protein [Polyangia bacterium]
MAEPTETPPRGPTNLRIKFRSASVEQFIERYAVDVSRGGIFIRTREPLAVGTRLKLEFQLQDATPLLAGEGTVVWIREPDPLRGNATPGMGVRFDKLTPESQPTLEKILAEKTRLQQTGAAQPAGPPAGLTKTSGGMAVRRSGIFQAVDPNAPKPGPISSAAEGATPAPPDAARPALGVTAKTSLPGGAGAQPGTPMGPFRARTTTGAGLRPAPVPSALFEPPTADDIDKALEALHETSGPTPLPGGGGLASGAAAPRFVTDDLSNEPTRVVDVVDELVGGSVRDAAAAPEGALETVDTGAVVAMEDAPSSGASSAALDAPLGDELPEVEPAQPLAPEARVENAGPIPIIGGVAHPIPPEKSTRFRAASSAYPVLQRRRRGLGIAIVIVGAASVVSYGLLELHWKDRFFPKSSPPIAAPIAEAPP